MKDYAKAEEMLRLALDSYEMSLGKDQEETKRCARNLAILLAQELKDKEKTREWSRIIRTWLRSFTWLR